MSFLPRAKGRSGAAADRVSVVATLIGFVSDDPDRNTEWFREERAIEKWWDPTTGVLYPEPGTGRKLACQIGAAARFDRETLDVEVIRYFHDDDGIDDVFAAGEAIKTVPSRLIRELGFFLAALDPGKPVPRSDPTSTAIIGSRPTSSCSGPRAVWKMEIALR
jgi:hypothetical protein